MLAGRWKRSLLLSQAAVFVWIFAGMAGQDTVLSPATIDEIRTALTAAPERGGPFFSEIHAEAFVQKYGFGAVPVLIGLLQEDVVPRNKGRICFYLGKFRDARAVQPIIDLIEKAAGAPVGKDEQFMLRFAMHGLGFTGEKVALDFLRKLARNEYWDKFTFRPFGEKGSYATVEGCRKEMRRWALRGIGGSGTEYGLTLLRELKEGDAADLVKDVDCWIRECGDRITGKHLEERKKYGFVSIGAAGGPSI